MLVTLSPMVTEVSIVQFSKAPLKMYLLLKKMFMFPPVTVTLRNDEGM